MYKFSLPDMDELILTLFSYFETLRLNILMSHDTTSLASCRDIDILEVKPKYSICCK